MFAKNAEHLKWKIMMNDIKHILKEFFILQKQVDKFAKDIDKKFEKLGILIEKLEAAERSNERVRRLD